jgi:hypothetical protein
MAPTDGLTRSPEYRAADDVKEKIVRTGDESDCTIFRDHSNQSCSIGNFSPLDEYTTRRCVRPDL